MYNRTNAHINYKDRQDNIIDPLESVCVHRVFTVCIDLISEIVIQESGISGWLIGECDNQWCSKFCDLGYEWNTVYCNGIRFCCYASHDWVWHGGMIQNWQGNRVHSREPVRMDRVWPRHNNSVPELVYEPDRLSLNGILSGLGICDNPVTHTR
jgi:hypothetical protein